ncbi:Hop2p [Ascoidea rubescens DSM 1968]|uniref:TBPIP-domain-containing protein n=1 Tax=Ascoidea rubescens DSM 1968 TaxID=1344418 RepID=A0A1D2VG46_9ASCO|nr:TBPIP-domain-containing protein [Ascoidea rubescens DSM 1968]ODV60562.1 TBPIP-domain-containing protein [Ascoidea rubescens DSM 1968]
MPPKKRQKKSAGSNDNKDSSDSSKNEKNTSEGIQEIKEPQKIELSESDTNILNYLNEQYRPYSLNDIYLNLQSLNSKSKSSKISKGNVVKGLEKLSSCKKIIAKSYGKQTFYVCLQQENKSEKKSGADEISDGKRDARDYTIEDINRIKKEIGELENKFKTLNGEYSLIISETNNEQLVNNFFSFQQRIKDVDFKIKRYRDEFDEKRDTINNKNENKKEELRKLEVIYEREFKLRFKIYKEFIYVMKENLSKVDELLETIGCEPINSF